MSTPSTWRCVRHRTLAAASLLLLTAALLAAGPADDGQPVVIANAKQYALTSKINGQTYRIMVYAPPGVDADKPLPVAYLLDGDWYFGAACNTMGMNQLTGLVVAIGYPTDDRAEQTRRRSYDLSLPVPNAKVPSTHGGGDDFLRVIDEEIKPLVAARYKVDPSRQALVGHSLGGLMVLRQLFRHPEAYATYVAASPSIWWAGRAVLADEAAFSDQARAGKLHLGLLVTSASDEEYHGTDPALLEKAHRNGMVSNAGNLATRLETLSPAGLVVTRQVINGDTHQTGAMASIVRGLRFAFQPPLAPATMPAK